VSYVTLRRLSKKCNVARKPMALTIIGAGPCWGRKGPGPCWPGQVGRAGLMSRYSASRSALRVWPNPSCVAYRVPSSRVHLLDKGRYSSSTDATNAGELAAARLAPSNKRRGLTVAFSHSPAPAAYLRSKPPSGLPADLGRAIMFSRQFGG